MRSIASISSCC